MEKLIIEIEAQQAKIKEIQNELFREQTVLSNLMKQRLDLIEKEVAVE